MSQNSRSQTRGEPRFPWWTPPRAGECAVRRMEQSSSGKRACPGFGSEPTCHRRRRLKVREMHHDDHQDSGSISPHPRTAFFVLIVSLWWILQWSMRSPANPLGVITRSANRNPIPKRIACSSVCSAPDGPGSCLNSDFRTAKALPGKTAAGRPRERAAAQSQTHHRFR